MLCIGNRGKNCITVSIRVEFPITPPTIPGPEIRTPRVAELDHQVTLGVAVLIMQFFTVADQIRREHLIQGQRQYLHYFIPQIICL